jgi:ATP-dependent Lon protease
MVTAIISIMTGIPVKKDVAMTGEITLRGRVLPIGGLKEKMLAALRAGIKTIVIPEENVKDLAEIGDEVKSHLQIVPASRMDDVLKVALQRLPNAILDEEAPAAAVTAEVKEEPRITAH